MAVRILPGPRLAERTTLGLGGPAQAELLLEGPDDAEGLGETLAGYASQPLMLGWGSNILALDQELDLVVVSLPGGSLPEILPQTQEGRQTVRVSGGMALSKLINWAGQKGLSGLEGLSGIPGTVGGAVAGNAGSYGTQMAEVLTQARVWSASGLRWIGPKDWLAAYRYFAPQDENGPWLVVEAEISFSLAGSEAVKTRSAEVLAQKKASQPLSARTCGCAFKNPPGESAGRLLEVCGFKGQSLGGMAFSPMHANFLVNEGQGSARAGLDLLAKAREAVKKRFGLELELEVRVLR